MIPPPRECPRCGELMLCAINECLGRTYYCTGCFFEESDVFDRRNAADVLDEHSKGGNNAA